MLRWAAIFLIIALIAALFGFTEIASASASIAQVLFGIFLILFLGAVVDRAKNTSEQFRTRYLRQSSRLYPRSHLEVRSEQ
jgi:uncharacterized membrane protein YtjA (UPF0391 family)